MPDATLADRWNEVLAGLARLRASLAEVTAGMAELRARVAEAVGGEREPGEDADHDDGGNDGR